MDTYEITNPLPMILDRLMDFKKVNLPDKKVKKIN